MEFEKYTVKGSEKKYKTAGGKQKTTVTKSIYLGSKSDLEVGSDVYIIPEDEFEKLKFKEEKEDEVQQPTVDVDALLENIQEISQKLLEIEKVNEGVNKELHQAKNMVILLQQEKDMVHKEIDYLKDIISEYEQYNLLERIINKNPKMFLDINTYDLPDHKQIDDEKKKIDY